MIKKGIGVTILFVISTFIQLISQIVVTRLVGATLNLDIFLAAVALPTIFVTVIYGTLNDAFLPLFGHEKIKNPKTAETYFMTHLLFLTFLFFIVAYIMNFISLPLSHLLYANRGDAFAQAVATQMNFMFYSLPVSVIATLLGTYFYSQKHFLRFPFAQLVGSIANLFLIVLLYHAMGIWSLVFAFVINILIQIFFVIPKMTFSFDISSLKLRTLFLAWSPLIVGTFALRTDTLLIRSFASQLPAGYLVYLNLISKIFSLGTSVTTVGIQILLLPHLVEYFANKQFQKASTTINNAKIIAIGVSILVTLLIALITPVLITIVFVGGKFTAQDAQHTTMLLPFFILPAIGWGINNVFFQPLLALKKQLPLGISNCIALVIGWTGGGIIKSFFGPLAGISGGLILLLFGSVLGSELLWQMYKRQLATKSQ